MVRSFLKLILIIACFKHTTCIFDVSASSINSLLLKITELEDKLAKQDEKIFELEDRVKLKTQTISAETSGRYSDIF